MKVGIGLPHVIPGTPGDLMPEWARRAEAAGFSSLATIDRIVYPGYESLISLAACASVTERIGLLTNILIAPTRIPVLLAKEAASLDRISNGRLTLGMAVGGRPDDYDAVGEDFANRGSRFDRDLELMHEIWAGKELSDLKRASVPLPGRAVDIIFGGTSEATLRRIARWGHGWTAGGASADMIAPFVEQVHAVWDEAGHEGRARIVALGYYALGPRAEEGARAYLGDYYAFLGERAEWVIAGAVTTAADLKDRVRQFEEAGATEVIFDPTIAEIEQVDLLAEAVL